MTLSHEDLAKALEESAELARFAASKFAPTSQAAIVGNVTAGLLALGARLTRMGVAPVAHITRLVDLGALMTEARNEVESEADQKFGRVGGSGGTGEPDESFATEEPTRTEGRGSLPPGAGWGTKGA